MIDQVMLVQTCPYKHRPAVQPPFVLYKASGNTHILLHVAVISRHHIV